MFWSEFTINAFSLERNLDVPSRSPTISSSPMRKDWQDLHVTAGGPRALNSLRLPDLENPQLSLPIPTLTQGGPVTAASNSEPTLSESLRSLETSLPSLRPRMALSHGSRVITNNDQFPSFLDPLQSRPPTKRASLPVLRRSLLVLIGGLRQSKFLQVRSDFLLGRHPNNLFSRSSSTTKPVQQLRSSPTISEW